MAGVSDAGLANLVNLAQFSMDAGCAGVMVAPVTGLNTDQKLYGYYAQVIESLGPNVPLCYQDYPQSTGVHLSVECFNRMVSDFPQLVMLKHEDCPGLEKLTQVRDSAEKQGLRRVSILTGNGGMYLPQELQRGANGAMTGFAYPEMLTAVVTLHADGEAKHAVPAQQLAARYPDPFHQNLHHTLHSGLRIAGLEGSCVAKWPRRH